MSPGTAPQRQASLRLRAPAKVNWALEVLDTRPDGYHEVRTLLQTLALSDWVTVKPADGLSFHLGGEPGHLAGEPLQANLAYRAAVLLRERAGHAGGARITLEKRVPVAAGLGGGSSDAAAVLRGLCRLWRLSLSDDTLAALAAELGADVQFFLRGGTALASGLGEALAPLPDGATQRLVLAWPQPRPRPDKTARMYAALREEHYTDGSRTERLAARLRAGEALSDDDLWDVFEELLPALDAAAAHAFQEAGACGIGRPHLAGSGPAFFFLLTPDRPAEPLLRALGQMGLQAVETQTLTSTDALDCEEQP